MTSTIAVDTEWDLMSDREISDSEITFSDSDTEDSLWKKTIHINKTKATRDIAVTRIPCQTSLSHEASPDIAAADLLRSRNSPVSKGGEVIHLLKVPENNERSGKSTQTDQDELFGPQHITARSLSLPIL